MNFQIEENVYLKIQSLCKEGDAFQKAGEFEMAIDKYQEALLLLPQPRNSWEAQTWILTAIGETYFYSEKYQDAEQYLLGALGSTGGNKNPFIHFRLGQTYYEMEEFDKAKKELTIAHDLDEKQMLFQNQNPKYLKLIGLD